MRGRRAMVERHLQRVEPPPYGARRSAGRRSRRSTTTPATGSRASGCRALSAAEVDRRVRLRGLRAPGRRARPPDNGVIVALPAPRWVGVGRPVAGRAGCADHRGRRAARAARAVRLVRRPSAVARHDRRARRVRRAAAAVLRALRANEVVCLLCDRDIQGGGVEVEFFGERTTLPAGPATLALRTGAPILPTAVYFASGRDAHHAVIRPPIAVATAWLAARGRRPHHPGSGRRVGGPHQGGARAVAPVPAELALRPGIWQLILSSRT